VAVRYGKRVSFPVIRRASDGPNMLPLDWLERLLPELTHLHVLAQTSAFRG
jgi:3-deoxy-D-manno-octulosonic acid (KDO) 8-phosphate synthase